VAGQVLRGDEVEALFPPPLLMLVQCLPNLNCIRRWRDLSLDATTATATRPASTVVRNWSHILNPADSETLTSQHSNCSLCTRTRSTRLMPAWRPNTNVETSNAFVLGNLRSGRSCLHSRIWGPLQSIGLDMLATSASRDCFSASQISNVNHCVVKTGIDVGNPPSINLLLRLLCHTRLSRETMAT
jgi:hypothetical protein